MPEQLALDQRLRDRGAIHRHKRTVPPVRKLMDDPRGQLLAGPRLAGQKDIHIGLGDRPDQAVHHRLLDVLGGEHEILQIGHLLEALLHVREGFIQGTLLDRLFQEQDQVVLIDRFLKPAKDLLLQLPVERPGGILPIHKDHRDLAGPRLDPADQLLGIELTEPGVEQDAGDLLPIQQVIHHTGLKATDRLIPPLGQIPPQVLGPDLILIDDQYLSHFILIYQ